VKIPPAILREVITALEELQGTEELGVMGIVKKSDKNEIRIAYQEYQGARAVHIRTWYYHEGAREMRPGKGITFKLERLEAVLDALRDAENLLQEAN